LWFHRRYLRVAAHIRRTPICFTLKSFVSVLAVAAVALLHPQRALPAAAVGVRAAGRRLLYRLQRLGQVRLSRSAQPGLAQLPEIIQAAAVLALRHWELCVLPIPVLAVLARQRKAALRAARVGPVQVKSAIRRLQAMQAVPAWGLQLAQCL
jgi:hypothetical protein